MLSINAPYLGHLMYTKVLEGEGKSPYCNKHKNYLFVCACMYVYMGMFAPLPGCIHAEQKSQE